MSTKNTNTQPMCCGEKLNAAKNSDGTFHYTCPKCGKSVTGKTPAEAVEKWATGAQANNSSTAPAIPTNTTELKKWADGNINMLLQSSAAWLDSDKNADKPATKRMIRQNIEYVIDNKILDAVWGTAEGQKSIIAALRESFYYGASMPDMGCIVPFGKVADFIPDVEAFRFALTTGENAPFQSLTIELIYENDKCRCSRINGEFKVEFENIPSARGEVRGVAVYGFNKSSGKVEGEMFDKERLMKKAETHSPSYTSYLAKKNYAARLSAAGETKFEDGREYYTETIPKKDGGTWDKKIFLDSISNPYDGPDQPEMLRKMAGKSFCNPYMKVRNAVELVNEWTNEEYTVDSILDRASDQFDVADETPDIQDADFEPVPEEAKEEAKI